MAERRGKKGGRGRGEGGGEVVRRGNGDHREKGWVRGGHTNEVSWSSEPPMLLMVKNVLNLL